MHRLATETSQSKYYCHGNVVRWRREFDLEYGFLHLLGIEPRSGEA
jgi:hypothetical protein